MLRLLFFLSGAIKPPQAVSLINLKVFVVIKVQRALSIIWRSIHFDLLYFYFYNLDKYNHHISFWSASDQRDQSVKQNWDQPKFISW